VGTQLIKDGSRLPM